MKRFSFRLETLLGHRKMLEDLRDQEFALAQGRHEQARLQLEALEEHYSRTLAERPVVDGEAQFDAPAIQSRERYLEAVRVRIDEQEGARRSRSPDPGGEAAGEGGGKAGAGSGEPIARQGFHGAETRAPVAMKPGQKARRDYE